MKKKKKILYRLKTLVRQTEREREERKDLQGHKEKDEIVSISIAN